MTTRPAIFLDRDGVINDLCFDADHGLIDSPLSAEQFHLKPAVPEALRILSVAGYALVVVSNQPAAAKGKMTEGALQAITARMRRELGAHGVRLDGVHYCLHHPDAVRSDLRLTCECRKPQPGLILRAAGELDLDVAASWLVGDGLTDIQAAQRAGCRSVWLGTWKCEHCQHTGRTGGWPDARLPTLLDAARHITSQNPQVRRPHHADIH